MSIEVHKIETGFSIKFPFALKDSFRETFRSAKWNPDAKRWEVGPRSRTRLDQWVQQVEGAASELDALDEQNLNEQGIARIQQEVERVRLDTAAALHEIKALGDFTGRLSAVRAMLEAEQAALADAKAKVDTAKADAIDQVNAVRSMLGQVIDFAVVDAAIAALRKWHNGVGGVARQKFDEAQNKIFEQRMKLQAAGLGSRGLDFLADANFNRPDRDHVNNMPEGALLDVYKIDQ